MKPRAYILEYDNGQFYEEHRTEVIAVMLDADAAKSEAERLTEWIRRKHKAAPECSTDMADEEFLAALDRQNGYFANLRCPRSAECLRDGARSGEALVRSYQVPIFS